VTDEHLAAKPTLVVGLVGDPGLPYRLAREIATDLAEELRREVADQWEWRVEAIEYRFTADEQGELALEDVVDVVARRHQRRRVGPGATAGAAEYLALAWLFATIATVGGAVGTGFASDEAVLQAADGHRQRERRSQL
jgi:hypothetical protein